MSTRCSGTAHAYYTATGLSSPTTKKNNTPVNTEVLCSRCVVVLNYSHGPQATITASRSSIHVIRLAMMRSVCR